MADDTLWLDAFEHVLQHHRKRCRALIESALSVFFETHDTCQAIAWTHRPPNYNDETYTIPELDPAFLIDGTWWSGWWLASWLAEEEHLGASDGQLKQRGMSGDFEEMTQLLRRLQFVLRDWLAPGIEQGTLVTTTREGIICERADFYY